MRHGLFTLAFILTGLLFLGSLPAHATPYWTPVEADRHEAEMERSSAPSPAGETLLWLGEAAGQRTDYLAMFSRIAHFQSILQVSDPGDPQFGGIREGEHMLNITQTDNTSEAIWVWSRYYELTGDNQYHTNLMNAWTYEMNFPAYLEEGDSSPENGYYRMYNSGWATRAELKYRDVYADETYHAYGDSCASYIRYHTLVRPPSGAARYYNPPVLSWALGNLYYRGVRENQAAWRENAVQQAGEKVKVWVEGEPALLANEAWAMSGGATMWGLLNSYFSSHWTEMPAWVTTYKAYMDTTVTVGSFTNAWKGWYALGHRAVGEALNSPYHIGVHLRRTEELVAEDADLDGGIPARPEDTDQMDQTWVANYLAFMGCDPLLPAAASAPDAGALPPIAGVLLRGAPNPARGELRLAFDGSDREPAMLTILDCSGRAIAALAAGAIGSREIVWRGRDDRGQAVPAGRYQVVLRTPAGTASRSFLWLK